MDFKTMLDFHLPPDRNTLAEDRTCKQARPAHPHRTLPDVRSAIPSQRAREPRHTHSSVQTPRAQTPCTHPAFAN